MASVAAGGCLRRLLLPNGHGDNSSVAGSRLELTAIEWPTGAPVTSLGVTLDSSLMMDRNVAGVLRSCNYHMRALRHICPLLTHDAAKMIAHSVVSSRLDYANALAYCTARLPPTSTSCRWRRTHWPGWCVKHRILSVPRSCEDNCTGCQSASE